MSPRANHIFMSASIHCRFLIFPAWMGTWRTNLSLFVVRALLSLCCCRVQRTISAIDTSSCVMPHPQTQANADSLGGGVTLGWMHYVQLANSSMNSLGPWQRVAYHKRPKLRIVRHKKYIFEMAGKMLAEGRRTISNHTLLCHDEGGLPDRAACASCVHEA